MAVNVKRLHSRMKQLHFDKNNDMFNENNYILEKHNDNLETIMTSLIADSGPDLSCLEKSHQQKNYILDISLTQGSFVYLVFFVVVHNCWQSMF